MTLLPLRTSGWLGCCFVSALLLTPTWSSAIGEGIWIISDTEVSSRVMDSQITELLPDLASASQLSQPVANPQHLP